MATVKLAAFLFFFILCVILSNCRPVFAQTKPAFACDIAGNPELKKFRFCDASLDVKTRVDDLVKRLTLQEKIGWIVNTAKGVSRLGIPNYEWWSEILHGISFIGPGSKFMGPVPGATSFPQVILTAATFNVSLYEAVGKVMCSIQSTRFHLSQSIFMFFRLSWLYFLCFAELEHLSSVLVCFDFEFEHILDI